MITNETAVRKLKRELNTMFTKVEQKELSFLPDKETKTTLSWFFHSQTKKVELVCNLRNGIITRCCQGK